MKKILILLLHFQILILNHKKYNIYTIGTILKNRIWKNYEISKDIKLLNKREYKFYKNKD